MNKRAEYIDTNKEQEDRILKIREVFSNVPKMLIWSYEYCIVFL